jgi:hypothetical protein
VRNLNQLGTSHVVETHDCDLNWPLRRCLAHRVRK